MDYRDHPAGFNSHRGESEACLLYIITCFGYLNLFTLNRVYYCASLLADEHATHQGHPPVFKCQD
jgi:hypothetical protein